MLKLHLLLEDDVEPLSNMSEVHLQKIMNTKIGPENTYVMRDERGHSLVNVPYANVAVVKENLSKQAKMLESCLYGESISPQFVMTYFVQSLRQIFQNEVCRQQTALEGNYGLISVMNKQRKSKTCLPPIRKSSASALRHSPACSETEWKSNLVRMLLDRNADIDRRIKLFVQEYRERHPDSFYVPKDRHIYKSSSIHVAKTIRARNYEKQTHSHSQSFTETKTFEHLKNLPDSVFDIDNPYFDEAFCLAKRIKVIHSCVVIQRAFLTSKYAKVRKAAIKIQTAWRGYQARRGALYYRMHKFRRAYFLGRLAHWFPLLANKFRERKDTRHFDADKYAAYVSYIRKIQKVARGYLGRKYAKFYARVQTRRPRALQIYHTKKRFWRTSIDLEARTLANSSHNSQDSVSKGVRSSYSRGARGTKEIQSLMTKLEKSESEYRKKVTETIKDGRLEELSKC
mmetsp:Transcript_15739/g.28769  ORF Transcript_15739/g.28769 Transcript_15739/m.28769 type:complete len:456 (+) Transcript_15739:320-1687(+)